MSMENKIFSSCANNRSNFEFSNAAASKARKGGSVVSNNNKVSAAGGKSEGLRGVKKDGSAGRGAELPGNWGYVLKMQAEDWYERVEADWERKVYAGLGYIVKRKGLVKRTLRFERIENVKRKILCDMAAERPYSGDEFANQFLLRFKTALGKESDRTFKTLPYREDIGSDEEFEEFERFQSSGKLSMINYGAADGVEMKNSCSKCYSATELKEMFDEKDPKAGAAGAKADAARAGADAAGAGADNDGAKADNEESAGYGVSVHVDEFVGSSEEDGNSERLGEPRVCIAEVNGAVQSCASLDARHKIVLQKIFETVTENLEGAIAELKEGLKVSNSKIAAIFYEGLVKMLEDKDCCLSVDMREGLKNLRSLHEAYANYGNSKNVRQRLIDAMLGKGSFQTREEISYRLFCLGHYESDRNFRYDLDTLRRIASKKMSRNGSKVMPKDAILCEQCISRYAYKYAIEGFSCFSDKIAA